eukprot:TRINITY_DN5843_c0_g1_i4.p1 TRINITY_DN5843_c0_g1~~TRINITY_DN5843_c0_g1_i4.p1  ORF type:complete len:209 (-),score=39.96 TRINITY_DN5843_c0_g1_i4:614-1240(-)
MDQFHTCANPTGLCSVSSSPYEFSLATLDDRVGFVYLKKGKTQTALHIPAHNTAVTQLVMSADGSRLATASEKGTIIRVFDCDTGRKIAEFRRGTQAAIIHSLAFNKLGTHLCLSSSTATVHVYSCDEAQENRTSGFSLLKGWVPLAGDVWSNRQIYVPEPNTICAFGPEEDDKHVIIVLSSTGKYYKYTYTRDPAVPALMECEENFF